MKRQVMRQPWRQQPHKPILVRLFSSNINFKGIYLQQDIITRPFIVSCTYLPFLYYSHFISQDLILAFSLLFSFHFTRSLGRGIASLLELVNA